MKRILSLAAVAVCLVMTGGQVCHAEKWVKNNVDVPNQNLDANYYDADSVKVADKTLHWTEKFVLTPFGAEKYTKHLAKYPACREGIEKKGSVAYHQIDFQIKGGKYRMVAKRNFTGDNTLVCTDKDMGTELDTNWYEIINKSPMSERYYILSTTYKLPDL